MKLDRFIGKLTAALILAFIGLCAPLNALADFPPVTIFPSTGAFQAHLLSDKNDVAMIELAGSYDRDLADGSANIEPRTVIAKEFYRTHPDHYDFIVVFSNFEFATKDALAFHIGVQNKIKGLGKEIYDNSALFGSAGKLQGYIDMAALSRYVTNPYDARFDDVLRTFSHEFLHQWASSSHLLAADGSLSDELLGKDGAHWSFLLDSGASVEYGNQWQDNGDGSFTSVAGRQFYSPLDLYLMGLYRKQEVPAFFLIRNDGIDKTRLPENGVTISGTRREVGIDDVIAADGPRVPDADKAQKEFRLGFVLLSRAGAEPTDAQLAAVAAIRKAIETRLAVMTGGRALAQSYSETKAAATVAATDPRSGDVRTGGASTADGLTWLRSQQAADGNWQDHPFTTLRDSVIAYDALTDFDGVSFTGRQRALTWLAAQNVSNTDYLARRLRTVAAAGGSTGDDATRLLAMQNSDGGWGVAPGYQSNPLDTALVLQALQPYDASVAKGKLDGAVAFLAASQNPDGGWGNLIGGASRTAVTAAVLQATAARTTPAALGPRAIAFLASRQRGDGGFGDGASTVHDTANVVLALLSRNALASVRAAEATAYVSASQHVDGSWDASVYSTSLALRLLKSAGLFNWSASGLTAAPAAPLDGQQTVLSFSVTNNGSATAPAGVARVYDGDPAATGPQIGQDLTLPALLAGESVQLSVLWNTTDKAGVHQIVAQVDPDGQTQEASKGDNRAQASINVGAAPAGVELQVDASAVTVSPARPSSLPALLAISAPVANIGRTDANAVRIVLLEGSGTTAKVVGEKSANLLGRSQQAINFSVTLSHAGATVYTVVVDPDGAVTETDKNNNSAAVTVETSAALDLEVRAADLSLVSTPVYSGGDANFKVKLRNSGTLDSSPFKVRYSVSKGTESVEVASRTLQLAAGATADQEVSWLSEFSGDLTFKVELDPDGILSESSKANNSAGLPFTVSDASGANLTASFKELVISPTPALERQPLTLSQVVRNTGTVAASNIDVGFYDGDAAAGHLIGALQTIATLAPGTSATVGVTWASYPDAQDHLIMAVVDPAAKQSEITRDDNTSFAVVSADSLADLAVSSGDMAFTPSSPKPGEAVSLSVNLSNLGKQAAANVAVRIYDGLPEQGGQAIGADQLIAQFDGLSSKNVVFTLPGLAGSGARTITVVVDPANAVAEQRKDNNSAQRTLAVQDGDLFVSNRYFSPNGDGVKDDTTLGFRLATAADVTVEVLSQAGTVVRSYSGDGLMNVQNGAVTWDGLNLRAETAADGDYRLRVVAKDGATLAESTVTLDNNRASVIDAIGTPFQRISPLTCGLEVTSTNYTPAPLMSFTTDEEQLYFAANAGDAGSAGHIYRESPSGTGLLSMAPAALLGASDFKISPNGEKVALSLVNLDSGNTEWWVMDGDKSNPKKVVDFYLPEYTVAGNAALTASGDALIVMIGTKLQKIPTDGVSPAVTLLDTADGQFGVITDSAFSLSPDRKRIILVLSHAYYDNEAYLIDVDSGQRRKMPAGVGNTTALIQFLSVNSAVWAPDSKKFVIPVVAAAETANGSAGYVGRYYVFDTEFGIVKLFETDTANPVASEQNLMLSAPAWNSTSTEFVFGHVACPDNCFWYEIGVLNENEQVMMHADLGTGTLEAIETTRKSSGVAESSSYEYLFVPNERRVLRTAVYFNGEGPSFEAVDLDGEQKITSFFTNLPAWEDEGQSRPYTQAAAQYFAPSGRNLILDANYAKLAPYSCYTSNASSKFNLSTLANLTAELSAVRSASAGGLTVRVTAADRNFARYQIEYAPVASPTAWKTVAPASDVPVVDQVVTTWVPPAFGNYLLRLTVEDQAGNQRQQTTRVSWSDTPSITDIYKDVEFISPNGDGVQDAIKLHYRVLEPVHLEFKVYGSDGSVIRTMERDHITIGEEASFSWDGRDGLGAAMPDGQYRMTLQDYEFFVTVDTTLPAVSMSLPSAYGFFLDTQGNPLVTYRSTLAWQFDDANLVSAALARSTDAGAQWSEINHYPEMLQTSTLALGTGQLVGNQYRMTVADKAGNQSALTTPLIDQQVFLLTYANHGHNAPPYQAAWLPTWSAPYAEPANIAGLPRLGQVTGANPLRLRFAETVRKPLSKVVLQFREIGAAEAGLALSGLDGLVWKEVLVNNFVGPATSGNDYVSLGSQAPDNFLEFLWDLSGVKAETDYMVRLKVADTDGAEFVAMSAYRFRLEKLVSAVRIDSVTDKRADSVTVSVLSTLEEPATQIELLIASTDDPRYLVERSIDTVFSPESSYAHYLGTELLQSLDLRICSPYTLRLKATLATGEVIYSDNASLEPRCLGTNWIVKPQTVLACNATPGDKLEVLLKPYANDGRKLTQLQFGQTLANGQDDILNNWTAVENGGQYSFVIDTAAMSEGAKQYFVRLMNEDGKTVTDTVSVQIAHASPAGRITSLHEGQQVCGIPARDPLYPNDASKFVSVVPVEGVIESTSNVSYALEYSRGAGTEAWKAFSPAGAEKLREGFSGLRQDASRLSVSPLPYPCAYTDSKLCFDFHPVQWASTALANDENFPGAQAQSGELGRLGLVDDIDGEVSVRMRLFNASGAQVCTAPVNINVDSKVRVQASSIDRQLFSPRVAAPLEHVSVQVAPDEAVTLNMQVFPASRDSKGVLSVSGPAVRTLAAGLAVLAGESVYEWDGSDDGKAIVADGWYVLRVSYMDGCGNTLVEDHAVEVDGTAPALALKAPATNAQVGLLVPVTGTVRDAHFQSFAVQYATAAAPDQWVTVASDGKATPADSEEQELASWNTLGLSGDVVLRITASDTLGNSSVQDVALQISQRTELVSYLESTPATFSPNGDRKHDSVAVRYSLLNPAVVTLEIVRTGSDAVVKTLMKDQAVDAGAAARSWDGINEAGTLETDGGFVARLTATSTAGVLVRQVETTAFALDTVAPKVAITYPKTDFVTPKGAVMMSASELHPDSYATYFASNPSGANWQLVTQGGEEIVASQIVALEGLAEGKYGVRVVATDAAENTTEVIKLFEIDATPPKVSLAAPLTDSYLSAKDGLVGITGAITEKNLSAYSLRYGQGSPSPAFAELAGGAALPGSVTLKAWDISSVPDGAYTLWLSADDLAGQSAEASLNVVIDNTPPVAAITAPAGGAMVKAGDDITGSASDANLLEFKLEVAPGSLASAARWSLLASGTSAVSDGVLGKWTALPADGVQTLKLTVTDKAGNSSVALREVAVDTLPPAAPLGLAGTLENHQDARLSWSANSESDLAGYALYRNGARLNAVLLGETGYLDAGLANGKYSYTVKAIDKAGLESAASAAVTLTVASNALTAQIISPAAGAFVSSLQDIKGTALAAADFKELRLYTGLGAAPSSWQLLRRSPLAATAEVLASWNTLSAVDGTQQTLKLEVEDTSGAIATATTLVTVDNTAPMPATLLVGSADGDNVSLSWNASTSADVAGYLVYRDGAPVSSPGGIIGSLKPYLVAGPAYLDAAVADGEHTYSVVAVDRAENVSSPSNTVKLTLDNRAPQAVIVSPSYSERVDGIVQLVASTPDTDVASVQFQSSTAYYGPWKNLGAAVLAAPYQANWDTTAVEKRGYFLRAVATDRTAHTDPAPAVQYVEVADKDAPDPVSNLVAKVNGGDVTLSWSSAGSDLSYYHLERVDPDGTVTRGTIEVDGASGQTDPALPDGRYIYHVYAYDGAYNQSKASNEVSVLVYTPEVVQPMTPTTAVAVALKGATPRAGELLLSSSNEQGTSDAAFQPAADGSFSAENLPLSMGENLYTLTQTDSDGNISKPAVLHVLRANAPATPTGLAVRRDGDAVTVAWNANSEADLLGYRVVQAGQDDSAQVGVYGYEDASSAAPYGTGDYREAYYAGDGDETTYWSPNPALAIKGQWLQRSYENLVTFAKVEVHWTLGHAASDYDVEAWDGEVWVPLASVRANAAATVTSALVQPYLSDRLRIKLLAAGSEAPQLAEFIAFNTPLQTNTSLTVANAAAGQVFQVSAQNSVGLFSDTASGSLADQAPLADLVAGADGISADPQMPAPGATARLTASVSNNGSAVATGFQLDLTATDPAGNTTLLASEQLASLQPGQTHTLAADWKPLGAGLYTVQVAADAAGLLAELDKSNNSAVRRIAVAGAQERIVLSVSAPEQGAALQLDWTAPASGAPVAYRIERATAAIGPYQEVATPGTLSYLDGGLVNGVTYWYVVTALDSNGQAVGFSLETAGMPRATLAPLTPVVLVPTPESASAAVTSPLLDIAGVTTPGAIVTLLRKDLVLATGVASNAVATVEFPVAAGQFRINASADGNLIASGGNKLDITDVRTGNVTIVPLANADAFALELSSDGNMLFYRESSGGPYVYKTADKSSLLLSDLVSTSGLMGLSRDDTRIALAGSDATGQSGLWMVTIASQEKQLLLQGDPGEFTGTAAWSPDNQYLAVTRNGVMQLVKSSDGSLVFVHANTPGDTTGSASERPSWSFDGTRLMYSYVGTTGLRQIAEYALKSGSWRSLGDADVERSYPQWIGPNNDYVDYEPDSNGTLEFVRHAYDGSVKDVLTERTNPETTLVTRGGDLVYWPYTTVLRRVTPGGAFRFAQTHLNEGDNVFTLYATDADGNRSATSAPVHIKLLSSAADLAASASDIAILPATGVVGEAARLTVTVRNSGNVAAANVGVIVSLRDPQGVVSTLYTSTIATLAAGASQPLTLDWTPAGAGQHTVVLTLDAGATVVESNELNNVAVRTVEVAALALPSVTVATNASEYGVNAALTGTVTLANAGPQISGVLQMRIEDSDGYLVEQLAPAVVSALGFGQSATYQATWNTGTILAGSYRLAAQLLDTDGKTLTSGNAVFTIGQSRQVSATVVLDQAQYQPGQAVAISGVVALGDANANLDGASALVQVLDANGAVLYETTQALGSLLPGASVSVQQNWNTGANPAGSYLARLTVYASGAVVAKAEAGFDLVVVSVSQMTGQLALSSVTPANGDVLTFTYSLKNSGNVALGTVPLTITVLDPDTRATVAHVDAAAELPLGASVQGKLALTLADWPLKTLQAVLSAEIGGNAVTLQRATLRVVDRLAPVLHFVTPAQEALLGGDSVVVVQASDASSTVASVEYAIDGATWLKFALQSRIDGLYNVKLPALADGAHQMLARATDSIGNISQPVALNFTFDSTAPLISVTGVVDGGQYGAAASAVVTVTDANLKSFVVTLDGAAYVPGTEIGTGGGHTLLVVAEDLVGNKASKTVAFSIGGAPVARLLAPVSGALLRAPFSISGQATGNGAAIALVEYQLDGAAWTAAGAVSGGAGQYEATVPALADGAHKVALRATDAAGAVSALAQADFTVDGTAPVVTVSGAAEGGAYAADVVLAIAIADANPSSSSILLNGQPYVSGAVIHEQGSYQLEVRAEDGAGNTASLTRKFSIDTTAPVITVAGVDDGQHYSAAVTAAVTVSESNLASSQILLDGAIYVSGTAIAKPGAHTLQISATDLAGNKASRTLQFDITFPPPVVTVTAPAEAALLRTPFTLTGTAGSTGSSVTAVEYQIDSGAWQAAAASTGAGSYQASIATLADGKHQLLLRATDAEGQIGSSASRGVVVDNSAPVITVTGVSNGASYTGAVTPVVAITDAHAYTTSMLLDGAAYAAGTAISLPGAHQLVIAATDEVDNKAETTLAFTINAQLTGSLAAAPKSVPVGEAVVLAVQVNNPGGALAAVAYQVTITDVTTSQVVQQFSDSGALAANGSYQKSFNWVTAGAAGASFRASVTAKPGSDVAVTVGSDTFTLAAQRISLTGAVSVSAAEVEVGATAVLSRKVVNGGGAISGVKLELTVLNAKTGAVVFQNVELIDLALNQAWSGDLGWKVTGPKGTVYTVKLAATAGGKVFALGETSFSAVAPVPKVELNYGAAYPQRVLVLSLCKRSEFASLGQCGARTIQYDDGSKLARCDAERANAVSQYLTVLKVSHKIVTSESAFATELKSGGYSAYWISGGGTKLQQPLQSELKAGLRLGEALLADGLHDIRAGDKALQELLGVRYLASLSTSKTWNISMLGGLYAADQFRVLGDALAVEPLSAAISEAVFQNATPSANDAGSDCAADQGYRDPSLDLGGVCTAGGAGLPARGAIVSSSFGPGRSLYFGFDWVSSFAAQADDARWLELGRESLAWLQPVAPDSNETLIARDVVTRGSHLHNQGQDLVLTVKAELPLGATALSADTSATVQHRLLGDLVTWQLSLAAGEERDISLQLRLPTLKGAYAMRYVVSTVVSGKTVQLADDPVAMTITDVAELSQAARLAVQAIPVSSGREALGQSETLSWIGLAQVSSKLGNDALALRQVAMAQARLDGMAGSNGVDGNDLAAARHAMARLLRAIERRN
jgi:uncharacterized repeat protein (TIGR01451 family)